MAERAAAGPRGAAGAPAAGRGRAGAAAAAPADSGAVAVGASRGRRVRGGPQGLLAATYALFALAAGARAVVQLATQAGDAPVAYALSALAAAVYLAGAAVLRRRSPQAHRVAVAVCAFELAGVVLVGALSRLDPGAFPDATVWSDFGGGYGHVPVLLPIAGLWWLLVGGGQRAATPRGASTE